MKKTYFPFNTEFYLVYSPLHLLQKKIGGASFGFFFLINRYNVAVFDIQTPEEPLVVG